ncbi:unnamed protein product, partial [Ectocarpus sp. 8 AP-2014]
HTRHTQQHSLYPCCQGGAQCTSMTKTRFTAADVRAMVRDLRSSVLGLRVANVYDLDSKTFLLKLASPGQEKAMLLLESGVRFHTTKFTHTKSDMPSGFSMKLRKHIRTQRLEDVRQMGMDRVVDFKFGSGKASNHVILELYASGNIILTDSKYEILDLLRTHIYEGQGGGAGGGGATGGAGDNVRVAVRQIYPMELATTQEGTTAVPQPPPSSSSDGAAAAAAAAASSSTSMEDSAASGGRVAAPEDQQREEEAPGAFVNGTPLEVGVQRMSEWLERAAAAAAAPPPVLAAPLPPAPPVGVTDAGGDNPAAVAAATAAGANGGGGGGKKKGGGTKKPKKATLKQALMQKGSGVSVYGPSIIEHCVLAAGLRPNAKLTPDGDSGGVHGAAAAAAAAAGGAGAAECSGNGGELRAGLSEDEVRELVVALGGAEAIVQQLDRPGQRGYIQCKPLPAPAPTAPAAAVAAGGSPADGE